MDGVLAEFSALRGEVDRRSNTQWTLFTFNFTVVGTLAAFVLTGRADEKLLVLLAVMSPALGLLFVDHGRHIRNIGDYVRYELAPLAQELTREPRLFKYEIQTQIHQTRRVRLFDFLVPVYGSFAGPAVVGLVASFNELSSYQTVLWWIGILLTMTFTIGLGTLRIGFGSVERHMTDSGPDET